MPSFSSLVLSLVLSLSAADVGVAPTSPNNLSVSVVGTAPEVFGAATPFILVARVKVQEGKKAEYLRAAAVADRGVMLSEPGMLHHTFDELDGKAFDFCWSEVYADDSALAAHLANPVVGEYLTAHAEFGADFAVEIYGSVGSELRETLGGLPFPVQIYPTALGYSRVSTSPDSLSASVVGTAPEAFGAATPFILVARVKVQEGKKAEYLRAAAVADRGVMLSEPGMLHHTFDELDGKAFDFCWSEVYADDSALAAHLANPVVGEYLTAHAEFGADFAVEIYGSVGSELREALGGLPFPVQIYPTALGYSRV